MSHFPWNLRIRASFALYSLIALSLALAMFFLLAEPGSNPSAQKARYGTSRQVRYGIVLENPTNQAVHNSVLWAYAPLKRTAFQLVTDLQASRDYKLITDKLGHRVLRFHFPVVPPFGKRQVTIQAELKMTEKPQPMESFSKRDKWLECNPLVQCSSSAIASLASKLRADTGIETAEKIWTWMDREITYAGYISRERGALHTLQHKEGDCTELADLYAALARACDIPTRIVAGFVTDGSGPLRRNMYHNWAESRLEGRWRVTDPQKKGFAKRPDRYVAFSLLGASEGPIPRGQLYKARGKGLEVRMK